VHFNRASTNLNWANRKELSPDILKAQVNMTFITVGLCEDYFQVQLNETFFIFLKPNKYINVVSVINEWLKFS